MRQVKQNALLTLAAVGLAACMGDPNAGGDVASASGPETADAACFKSETLPAVIETVTEKVLVTPAVQAADGSELAPATYDSQSLQKIVQERRTVRFETVCEAAMTAEVVASLQRALAVRGGYDGTVTGRYDAATRAAVKRYQSGRGLPSTSLSLQAARELGLVAYSRNDL